MVALDSNLHPIFNPDALVWLNLVVFCLAMGWLRYRFESVWPSVIAHNVDNGFAKIISALAASTLHLRSGV
jgi:hypothetical protein